MTNKEVTKHKIGDKVWVAWAERRDVTEACPVCFGKREVMLALGNGDTVVLPCDYCGKGYSQPIGKVTEIRFGAGAELKTIDQIETRHTSAGEEVEYRAGNYSLAPDRIFGTKEEALRKSEDIVVELNKEQITRTEYIKADVKKTFSWNAGYHLREAKNLEERAARHKLHAKLCKARSREPEALDAKP